MHQLWWQIEAKRSERKGQKVKNRRCRQQSTDVMVGLKIVGRWRRRDRVEETTEKWWVTRLSSSV